MTTDATAPWRIVLFSDQPQVAGVMQQVIPALGHKLVALVTSGKRSPDFIGAVQTMAPDIDVMITQRPRRLARLLSGLEFDVLLCVVFPLRLPADVLALPRLGAVNMHPSTLPAYRGTMTPNWHLLNGETQIGLTLHRMTPQFDDGAILAQTSVPIDPDDDMNTMMRRLFSTGPQVLAEGFARLAASDPGRPQDASQASYFGVMDPALRNITWDMPARTIHNRVRAHSAIVAELGVVAQLEGEALCITRSRVIADEGQTQRVGTWSRDADGTLMVQCGSGVLALLESAPVIAA